MFLASPFTKGTPATDKVAWFKQAPTLMLKPSLDGEALGEEKIKKHTIQYFFLYLE